MGDAQLIGYLLLGLLPAPAQAEAEGDDFTLPLAQLGNGGGEKLAVYIVLDGPHNGVRVSAQDVAEQQFVAVPVGVERFVQAHFAPLGRVFAEVHQDFVLYAAGRVGGQLDVLVRAVGVYRLDQADGPNGNEILYVDACVLKPAGNVDDQAEVALNEDLTGFLLPRVQAGQDFRFLLPGQRRGEGVAAADVLQLSG